MLVDASRGHRPNGGRWPALAPLYGVQFRTGHAITFGEDDHAAAVRFAAESPDRRLVVARWVDAS